jgi:hypothetical protein
VKVFTGRDWKGLEEREFAAPLFFVSLGSLFDLGYAEGAIRRNSIPFHDTADFFAGADSFLHIGCSRQYAAHACVKMCEV